MLGKSALIIGATGAVGKFLLQELLSSPAYSRVGEFGRRVTSSECITTGKEKLVQKVLDFENLGASRLKQGKWDVVFLTFGTQMVKVGSDAAFEKIDREYVVNVAREAMNDDPSVSQRVVYVSSAGADPKSHFLYPRSKGLTELGLAELGYKETIIFRPAALTHAERSERRLMESVAISLLNIRKSWVRNYSVPCPTLATALKNVGVLSSATLQQCATKDADVPFTLVDNQAIRPLADVTL